MANINKDQSELYNSYTHINCICIVWAVISVELTLYWNEIKGVYTLQSTGQLILFVIGLIGFLRLLHGISIEHSKLGSTNILMVSLANMNLYHYANDTTGPSR